MGQGFSKFSGSLHHFVMAESATSSIRDNCVESARAQLSLRDKGVIPCQLDGCTLKSH